jgi:hypothetical protein
VGTELIYHYDDRNWNKRRAPAPLYDVWGTAADDVYAVGDAIAHWNGEEWRVQTKLTRGPLRAIWGASDVEIFAVGDDGLILHYDGSRWDPMESAHSGDLTAVGGTAPDNVLAVGDGVILHYDGIAWSALPGAPDVAYRSLWGSSGGALYLGADSARVIIGEW